MTNLSFISQELAMIINLRNTAIDHKQKCNSNCNISLYELRQTAIYLSKLILDNEHEQLLEAAKLIEEMPIL